MKNLFTLFAVLFTLFAAAQGNPELNSVTLLGEASNPTLVEGKLFYNTTIDRAYIGNSAAYQLLGDFLADGTVPMTGGLNVNSTGGVMVSTDGSSNLVASMSVIGFKDFNASGEGAKFNFGDDFNGIFNSYGNGLLYNGYHTMHFRQAVTAPADGNNYPNVSNVSFLFHNFNNRSFRIQEQNAASTADFFQLLNQEGTKLSSFDVNGVLQGLVFYDNASSLLTATDTQSAIDEVEGRVDAIESGASGIPSDVTGLTGASTVTNIVKGAKADIDGWAVDNGRLDVCTDCPDYTSAQSGTGTAIDLQYSGGYFYNMDNGDTHTATTYTISASRVGGKAKLRVNVGTEPTVTGATKITGSDFQASTDMYLVLQHNGVRAEYFFLPYN